jgi:hypothetical protein
MALADTELEPRAWVERLAIQDLIYRYSDALTRADWKQAEALFAADAIWEYPQQGLRFDSRTAFMEFLAANSTLEMIIQTPHAPVITLLPPDQAQATTTIHEWMRGVTSVEGVVAGDAVQKGDEINLEVYGIYYDDITRIDGDWKFTHRLYVPIYIATGAVTGEAVTPRSELLRTQSGELLRASE